MVPSSPFVQHVSEIMATFVGGAGTILLVVFGVTSAVSLVCPLSSLKQHITERKSKRTFAAVPLYSFSCVIGSVVLDFSSLVC